MRQSPGGRNLDDNVRLQAEEHPLVADREFATLEHYVLHLMHERAYQEASRLATGKDVLDLGCNNGYGLKIVRPFARQVAGLDVSPQAVEAARSELGPDVQVELYDGRRSALEAERFDVVLSFQVIEHVADLDPYLDEMKRLLRPGGLAVLTTPNAAFRLDPGMRPWNRFHVHEYQPVELADLLSRWFAHVDLQGLFATPELYRVEKARVDLAREAARRGPGFRGQARQMVRTLLGESGRELLRRVRPSPPRRTAAAPALDPALLARFSTADLSYRPTDLDDAMDLMALCRKAS